jgi:hypothetical protein
VKSDVRNVHPRPQWHAEGLNRAIEVLVIERVLIVPYPCIWSCHLVANKANAIVARSGLDLVHRRASPGVDSGLHSHRVTDGRKCERRVNAADAILTVRSVVILVAFTGMSLAPVVLVLGDVLRFGKIGRAWIEACVQISDLNQNSVRRSVMHVGGVVVVVWRCL